MIVDLAQNQNIWQLVEGVGKHANWFEHSIRVVSFGLFSVTKIIIRPQLCNLCKSKLEWKVENSEHSPDQLMIRHSSS